MQIAIKKWGEKWRKWIKKEGELQILQINRMRINLKKKSNIWGRRSDHR